MALPFRLMIFPLVLCLPRLALAAEDPASRSSATPHQVHQTVDRAIGYLQTESATWLSQRKCAACHHAAMPLWALSEADRQGYTIDKKFLADTIESTLGSVRKMMDSKIIADPAFPPDPRPMARGVSIGAVFMAVAGESLPSLTAGQEKSVKFIVDDSVKKQLDDGSWEFFLSRPPINQSQATDAAWIIMALQGEAGPGTSESHRTALKKAMTWLSSAEPSDDQQVKVLKLLVSLRAGKPRDTLQSAIDDLLTHQRPDGGWSQKPEMNSDAFATGQTLYVLALGGYTADQLPIRRAIDFLVATQKPDGSWPMTSRATPDGRPGSAKLLTPITCAASAWATMGLVRLSPSTP